MNWRYNKRSGPRFNWLAALSALRTIVGRFAFILTAVAALLTFLPLIEIDFWWVKGWEFVRLHLLFVLTCSSIVLLLLFSRVALSLWAVGIGFGAILFNAYHLAPYLLSSADASVNDCPAQARLRVMVANVDAARSSDRLFRFVHRYDPDLFLVVETDEWWDRQLERLTGRFVDTVQQIAGTRAHFGIHLFSKYRIVNSKILFPGDPRVPAVTALLSLRNGETVSLYGLHPRPPKLFGSSSTRDAQLRSAANSARQSQEPSIVAGDLNAVPWEPIFQQILRSGNLVDPRARRGYIATFNAKIPILYWPIDHVLSSKDFDVLGIWRGPAFGSDHWPIIVDLCRSAERNSQTN